MRVTRFACASLVAGGLFLASSSAFAQDTPQALRQEIDQLRRDFDALKQQYGDRLTSLEAKLAAAEGAAAPAAAPAAVPTGEPQTPPTGGGAAAPTAATAQVPPGAEGAGGPSGALPVYGGSVSGSKVFNPDI